MINSTAANKENDIVSTSNSKARLFSSFTPKKSNLKTPSPSIKKRRVSFAQNDDVKLIAGNKANGNQAQPQQKNLPVASTTTSNNNLPVNNNTTSTNNSTIISAPLAAPLSPKRQQASSNTFSSTAQQQPEQASAVAQVITSPITPIASQQFMFPQQVEDDDDDYSDEDDDDAPLQAPPIMADGDLEDDYDDYDDDEEEGENNEERTMDLTECFGGIQFAAPSTPAVITGSQNALQLPANFEEGAFEDDDNDMQLTGNYSNILQSYEAEAAAQRNGLDRRSAIAPASRNSLIAGGSLEESMQLTKLYGGIISSSPPKQTSSNNNSLNNINFTPVAPTTRATSTLSSKQAQQVSAAVASDMAVLENIETADDLMQELNISQNSASFSMHEDMGKEADLQLVEKDQQQEPEKNTTQEIQQQLQSSTVAPQQVTEPTTITPASASIPATLAPTLAKAVTQVNSVASAAAAASALAAVSASSSSAMSLPLAFATAHMQQQDQMDKRFAMDDAMELTTVSAGRISIVGHPSTPNPEMLLENIRRISAVPSPEEILVDDNVTSHSISLEISRQHGKILDDLNRYTPKKKIEELKRLTHSLQSPLVNLNGKSPVPTTSHNPGLTAAAERLRAITGTSSKPPSPAPSSSSSQVLQQQHIAQQQQPIQPLVQAQQTPSVHQFTHQHQQIMQPHRQFAPISFQDFTFLINVRFLDESIDNRRRPSIGAALKFQPPSSLQDFARISCLVEPELTNYEKAFRFLLERNEALANQIAEMERQLQMNNPPVFHYIQAEQDKDKLAIVQRKFGRLRYLFKTKATLFLTKWKADIEQKVDDCIHGSLISLEADLRKMDKFNNHIDALKAELDNEVGKSKEKYERAKAEYEFKLEREREQKKKQEEQEQLALRSTPILYKEKTMFVHDVTKLISSFWDPVHITSTRITLSVQSLECSLVFDLIERGSTVSSGNLYLQSKSFNPLTNVTNALLQRSGIYEVLEKNKNFSVKNLPVVLNEICLRASRISTLTKELSNIMLRRKCVFGVAASIYADNSRPNSTSVELRFSNSTKQFAVILPLSYDYPYVAFANMNCKYVHYHGDDNDSALVMKIVNGTSKKFGMLTSLVDELSKLVAMQ